MELRTSSNASSLGRWDGDPDKISFDATGIASTLARVQAPCFAVSHGGALGLTSSGQVRLDGSKGEPALRGYAAPCRASALGDPSFAAEHRLRFNYVAGAMAGGIASVELVQAMSRAGMLGFFGAAGLGLDEVEASIDRLQTTLLDRPWGSNLIHSPYEPRLEDAIVDLYLRRGVQLVSASAYLDLTRPLLRYRLHGIHRDASGAVVTPNRVIGKVSRAEVARKFLCPAPKSWIRALVEAGDLSPAQAELAATVPVASDLTVEADSGGHTDNRQALALLPSMLTLRDQLQAEYRFPNPVRVGAAGGIGTPRAAAAAFAMGAAYIVTGTINQACTEAGTSDAVRQVLADAGQADVAMAPAADMFEMGVELQVLRRGTLFPMRARKLFSAYSRHDGIEAIPAEERAELERTIFRESLDDVWAQTRAFWLDRDPTQVERAEASPKHRMALCFRSYLGRASRWANQGFVERKADFQVWCGPAIGAFNSWTAGSFLERWDRRRVVPVALNLLHGAAVTTRASNLRTQGVVLAPEHVDIRPRPVAQLEEFIR